MPHDLRPIVVDFARALERRLREHDATKGDTWRTIDTGYLESGLLDGVIEAQESNELEAYAKESDEWLDVAAYALFLWVRARELVR